MRIELDLKVIKRNSEQREGENLRFRSYLKGEDSENIDKIVHRLYENVLDHIDCTECGNCCVELETCFQKTEIEHLCKFLDIDKDKFIEKNTKTSEFEEKDTFVLKSKPCLFLENKKCTIYSHRPEQCSSYPYLHKDDFNSRLFGVLENYGICPIVYNVVELLKHELNYKR
jgi:hypothetical protein